MKIFFDGQVFRASAYGGGGRFFLGMIRQLTDIPGCDVALFAGAYRTPLPVGSIAFRCRPFYGFRAPPLGGLRPRIEPVIQSVGRWCLDHSKADIYHPTYYDFLASRKSIPKVVTIFDLIHERHPQYYVNDPTASQCARALGEAAAVVCISGSTARQAAEIYPGIADRISVIPLASSMQAPDGDRSPLAPPRPYFLFVGNRGRYKNFRLVIDACRGIPRFAENFTLVCYGGGRFTAGEQQTLADAGLQSCVEQRGGDDAWLAPLYRDALCFIYPSLEEGFGIPLLEAMQCRCAVLASRIPVFEEVAGDAAGYFDPDSSDDLAARMREMAEHPGRREELVLAGTRRAALYSWERCARQHHELYARIVPG